MRPIHFISGLPRSGSTLLSAILRQNPRFHAAMSGPLAGIFNALLGEMSGKNEFSVFISDEQRRDVVLGLVESFYRSVSNAEVIFDSHRLWCTRLQAINELFPNARIIACVRHIPWVLDSIERLIRNNWLQPSSIFNYQPGGTVFSRAESLAAQDGLIGFAYRALKEAFFGGCTKNLMLLQYETLVNDPGLAIGAIYDFLHEPRFSHDFEHVEYSAEDFDTRAGTPGLHRVRRVVGYQERTTILPPDLFKRYENESFWQKSALNLRGVRIV